MIFRTLPFGQALKVWRQARGLTQEQLAGRARVSRPNLSAMECGQREVTLGTLRALAVALGVRPGVLVDGVPPVVAEGTVPPLSREAVERMANAAAFGHRLTDAGEQAVVEALRMLLGHRTLAIRHRWSRPRTSQRAALAAWATLSSVYGREAIQTLADRVAERQRADDSQNH